MRQSAGKRLTLSLSLMLLLTACGDHPWNDPYPRSNAKKNILYTSFSSPPKTLDPARSYTSDENIFIAQIYEPPIQYHYLKRPYTLVPLTAVALPHVSYLDKQGRRLPSTAPLSQVAFSLYDITIKKGIYFQPHPAFAKDKPTGDYLYHHLKDFHGITQLKDFKVWSSRELVADDYVYEIKRLAQPRLNSPIYGMMSTKIVGLAALSARLKNTSANQWQDLRQYPLAGAYPTGRYQYRIIIKGKYPQFIYWLAMAFFAPVPWEGDAFYAQQGLTQKNISFDWAPIGTGPYYLSENNPNRQMVLKKNPLFHPEYFPLEGEKGDDAAGYLRDKGQRLPFIDQVTFTLEKESIPRWNKFLQGYYDKSTIGSDSFDQAIQIDGKGKPFLTPLLKKMGVYLQTTITQAITYLGFNMLDPTVGGSSERARYLRLAISIAVDYEEFINIFLNGRGMPAQGPLPPNIFGFVKGANGINPYVYVWRNGEPSRRPISVAKDLMRRAGYRSGIDPKTKQPLILNYDLATTSGPDEKALLSWMREQFSKIGIALHIRNTDYNRFQQIVRLGEAQIFSAGWIADYPDPENFLFLLYSANGKAKHAGENLTNYHNSHYDRLFNEMKDMPNDVKRQAIINRMVPILRHDAPWVWGIYHEEFVLNHIWVYPSKPHLMTHNVIKYERIDPLLRDKLRRAWNVPIIWPLLIVMGFLLLSSLPVLFRYWVKERSSVKNHRNKN